MARDPYQASTGDLSRGERWDRDRFVYERERDRYGDERIRYEEDHDDHVYPRGPVPRGPLPPRGRDSSVDFDRRPGGGRGVDDEYVIRDRRFHLDEDRYGRPPPPRSPAMAEFERKVVIDRERVRSPSPPPPRRPAPMLRRQSSLDTFDRRPPPRFYEREEYGPPARRDDFRPPPNVPIPLPRTRALPPPRRYNERDYYEEIRVSDPDHYGDEDFRPYPERVREKEVIRTRRREHSPESRSSRTRSHRGSTIRSSSRSSSVSSSSSSSSGGTTVKSEYPKKGKTRIPARLVSKRALNDLGYPWIEEGNTIIVQKALGQDNIDDLLKLSESYKKTEIEVVATRPPPPPTEVIEERREEFFMAPAVPPPMVAPVGPPPPPILMRNPPPPAAHVEIIDKTVIRDISPARSSTTTTTSHGGPVIVDARPREMSSEVPVGPLALVAADHHHHHHHHRHRSHSRGDRALRAEIRDLELELARRERRSDRDLVAAERLSNGELVLFEERVEKIEEPRRGVRIEKDKKGRMSISVPKYR